MRKPVKAVGKHFAEKIITHFPNVLMLVSGKKSGKKTLFRICGYPFMDRETFKSIG